MLEKNSPKKKKKLLSLLLISCMFLVLAEIASRRVLGLGDPPLFMADPQIEYLFKPSAVYKRFGNSLVYNAYSMRNEEFPRHKTDSNELRVMMIGDSVVYGGAQIDQKDLASEILEDRLNSKLNRPVIVGNISAGSWGPPNQLAYIKRFGFFDADVVLIVLSSHDFEDVPTFKPIVGVDPDFPNHKPILAVQEAITRYLPRFLGLQKQPEAAISNAGNNSQSRTVAMGALHELIILARQSGAKVILSQHLEKEEAEGRIKPGHDIILRFARSLSVPVYQIGDRFKQQLQKGENPYRDVIHPNALGQKLIAETLETPLYTLLKSKSS